MGAFVERLVIVLTTAAPNPTGNLQLDLHLPTTINKILYIPWSTMC